MRTFNLDPGSAIELGASHHEPVIDAMCSLHQVIIGQSAPRRSQKIVCTDERPPDLRSAGAAVKRTWNMIQISCFSPNKKSETFVHAYIFVRCGR